MRLLGVGLGHPPLVTSLTLLHIAIEHHWMQLFATTVPKHGGHYGVRVSHYHVQMLLVYGGGCLSPHSIVHCYPFQPPF